MGELLTWGKGGSLSALGHGVNDDVNTPTPVMALEGYSVVHVACGLSHTLAVTSEGLVFSWGNNDHGKLGMLRDLVLYVECHSTCTHV